MSASLSSGGKSSNMPRVFIGMGSNIDRESNIRGGINAVRQIFGDITLSSIYESRAYGFEGENFYNLVAAFDTDLSLDDLTEKLREIEYSFGRKRNEKRFLSRTLDIDLLVYDDIVRHDDKFDLPRQDIIDYAFVLCPLAEIAGEQKHPEKGQTFNEMWKNFDRSQQELWPVSL